MISKGRIPGRRGGLVVVLGGKGSAQLVRASGLDGQFVREQLVGRQQSVASFRWSETCQEKVCRPGGHINHFGGCMPQAECMGSRLTVSPASDIVEGERALMAAAKVSFVTSPPGDTAAFDPS